MLLIISPLLLSQEEPYMYYKELEKGDSAVVIDTGYVVINGVLLRPPLHMELKNDTIWINSIAASPVLPYSGPIRSHPLYPRFLPQAKLDSSQTKLVSDIKDKYKEYNGEFGEKKAQEMIISEYQSDPLISSLTLYESEASTSFKVVFSDSIHIGIPVRLDVIKIESEILPDLGGIVSADTVEGRKKRALKRHFQFFQKHLRMGGMVFLTSGGISGLNPKGILETAAKMKNGELSPKEGIEQLHQYHVSGARAIMILENIESW
jgi:hypothetical protein